MAQGRAPLRLFFIGPPPARCRGADSRARHGTSDWCRPSLKWYALPNCHCEEAAGRRGALSAKREEVPLGCNLGKAVTISPGAPCYPPRSCEIATAPSGPRNDKSEASTVLTAACSYRRHCAGPGCPRPYSYKPSHPNLQKNRQPPPAQTRKRLPFLRKEERKERVLVN